MNGLMVVWMIGTQFPILIALFEYGIVLYWIKITRKSGGHGSEEIYHERIKYFDFVTMVFSLTSFIVFTMLYWIILPI